MAQHIWSVLCSRLLEDPTSRVVSLIDVIEGIDVVMSEPSLVQDPIPIPIGMTIVSFWTRSGDAAGESYSLRATIRLPNGRTFSTSAVKVVFEKSNYRQQFKLPNLPFMQPGRYWFIVEGSSDETRWTTATEIPLQVNLVSQAVGPKPALQIEKKTKRKKSNKRISRTNQRRSTS
jgi:hypothetical protein